jgi:hypothetical protein
VYFSSSTQGKFMPKSKDLGKDGKREREFLPKRKVAPNSGRCESRMEGFRASGVFCFLGHELDKNGIPVTLANCVGNLFPAKRVCRSCGVCEEYRSQYRNDNSAVVVRGISLYPQMPVMFDKGLSAVAS